jgi:hypothetical protein
MRTITVALVALAAAGPLGAQRAPQRAGQWLGLGVGVGHGRVSCQICVANRRMSLSGFFRAGGTLSRRTLLGGELNGWLRRENDVDEYLLAASAVVSWYPNPRRGLFYKGGVAVMLYHTDDGPNRLSSTAFGPQLGAGLDIPLSPSVSFTPHVNWLVASLGGEMKFNGSTLREDVGLMLIQVGMGVTWH